MTLRKIILLCCLLVPSAVDTSGDAGEETLIVGPGEPLALEAPEAGVRVEAALDGGPLKPIGPTLKAPPAGDHWLALAGRDRAGNLSEVRWVRLRVDDEPPRVELEPRPAPVEGDRRWMPPRATVAAAASDDLAGVARLSVALGDEVTEVTEPTAVVELPAAGEVTVRAWAIDDAGNRSAETVLELAIDATPPSADIYAACQPSPHSAAAVVAPDCRILVVVGDGESGVGEQTLRVDDKDAGFETLDGPWLAGPHAVEVAAVDAVGNPARVGPFAFTADDAGPEIAWRVSSVGVEGAGGETFYRPPVTLTVEATDLPAGLDRLAASTDGASYAPVAGPLEVDGDRLLLRAVDGVGNASDTEASWRLDRLPPDIHLETAGGEAVPAGTTVELERGATVRFRTVDAGAGVEAATYSLTVESADILRRWWWMPPREEPLPDELAFPWPGQLGLTVEAVDRLGNRRTARWRVVVRSKGGSS